MEAHEALRRHEHIVEANGHSGGGALAQQAALMVAVIAVFLAVATFLATNAQTRVVIGETKAADAGARLEANETRTTMADSNATLLRVIGADGHPKQATAIAEAEQLEERIVAEYGPIDRKLEHEIEDEHHQRDRAEHQHLLLELSEVALQIGIVLAGVAILARRRWLLGGGGLIATAGIALLAVGALY